MSLVDVGANLAHKRFRHDLPAVLARARAAGVEAIVATGTSEAASRRAFELAEAGARERWPVLLASTAGVHPHEARSFDSGTVAALRALAARPEVVAIGECGLDHDRDFSPRPQQLRAFEAQLELAAELGMPVFLHERAAHEDFVSVLRAIRPRLSRAVVHCFTGTAAELERYLALGLHVGITGFACDPRRGAHLPGLAARVPPGRLLVETDAPFLLPRSEAPPAFVADGRNEPALLPVVVRALARARGVPPEQLAEETSAAARAFFGLRQAGPTRPRRISSPTS